MEPNLAVAPAPLTKPIPGPKIMLIGDVGAGKTYSLRTLLDVAPNIEVFCVFTEPGMETVGDLNSDRFHWTYIPPATPGLDSLIAVSDNINKLSYEGLSKMSATDKSQHRGFYNMLQLLKAPLCDRCGRKFPNINEWPASRILVFDSFSGISAMASGLMVGSKPTRAQGEWGVSMSLLDNFVMQICTGLQCSVIFTAHPEREQDLTTGAIKIMASTLGKALSPKLPRNFSDVILAERNGTKFSWNTASEMAVTKARNVPIASGLPPSFVPLFQTWLRQGGKLD